MNNIVNELIAEMRKMPVIDAHEHLPAEPELLGGKPDIFTRIFCHYSLTNAFSAGLKTDREMMTNTDIPLEKRWNLFRPYLKAIKNTGYALAARICARDIYGIEDINDNTYLELSSRIQAANTPGLYQRILKDKCNIERVINQGSWNDGPDGYCISVARDFLALDILSPENFRNLYLEWKEKAGSDFEDANDWLEYWMKSLSEQACVGIKHMASIYSDEIKDSEAQSAFVKLKNDRLDRDSCYLLTCWIMQKSIEKAPNYNFVVAIHCGLNWTVNADFRQLSPLNIIPLLLRYPDTRFDLYHAGIPWVREIAVMANQYPNVNLNLVWCHQISPFMTRNMLNEWIDLVPANKIIGFGGDYNSGPEKVYGALELAYENIARALAERLNQGLLTESDAIEICRAWLYENPKKIYSLC